MTIDYKDYLDAFGLLTSEEKIALIEHKKEEAIRIKKVNERKQADVMSWLYSKNYTEEPVSKVQL